MKSLLLRNGLGLPQLLTLSIAVSMVSYPAYSQSKSEQVKPKRVRSAFLVADGYRDYNNRVYLDTGFGLGTYNSVILPLSTEGTPESTAQIAEHSGVPLSVSLGNQFKILRTMFDISATYMSILPLTSSEVEAQKSAGLSQLDLDAHGQLLMFGPVLVELGAFGQRTHYKTGSTGHASDVWGAQAGLGFLAGKRWQAIGRYRHGVDASFGYDEGGFSSRELSGASAEYRRYAGELLWGLAPRSHLVFGFVRDELDVVLPDIRAYREFGLNVSEQRAASMQFSLITQHATLGFLKAF